MSDLPFAKTEPAPALAPVIELHPDGIIIRIHEHDDPDAEPVYWVERRRGSRSSAAVCYSPVELRQLRDAIERVLR